MKSYSELEVFSPEEIDLWIKATAFVEKVPAERSGGTEIRCHELSRAVAQALGLQPSRVQDGHYGFVEHSWIWLGTPERALSRVTRLGFPNILDVYAVGQLPQVRLVACGSPGLPHVGWAYRPGAERTDIDRLTVLWLYKQMTLAPGEAFEVRR